MVKLAIMEMIATLRPWPALRYATTSESAHGARVPRGRRGCVADAGESIGTVLPKRHTTDITRKSALYPTSPQ